MSVVTDRPAVLAQEGGMQAAYSPLPARDGATAGAASPDVELAAAAGASSIAPAAAGEDSDDAILDDGARSGCGHGRDAAGMLPGPPVSLLPCGRTKGHTLSVYRSSPTARMFPFVMVVGPHFPCLLVTASLILGPTIAFLLLVAPHIDVGLVIAGACSSAFCLGALLVTAFSDPGHVTKQRPKELRQQQAVLQAQGRAAAAAWERASAVAAEEGRPPPPRPAESALAPLDFLTVCGICNVLRERGTHHCYDCGVCVRELDHHCPWSSTCIGGNNLRPFYAFVWSLMAHFVLVVASVLSWIVEKASRSA